MFLLDLQKMDHESGRFLEHNRVNLVGFACPFLMLALDSLSSWVVHLLFAFHTYAEIQGGSFFPFLLGFNWLRASEILSSGKAFCAFMLMQQWFAKLSAPSQSLGRASSFSLQHWVCVIAWF